MDKEASSSQKNIQEKKSKKNKEKKLISISSSSPSMDQKKLNSSKMFRSFFFWILILGGLLISGYFSLRMYGEKEEKSTNGKENQEIASSSLHKTLQKETSSEDRVSILEAQVKHLTETVERYASTEKEMVTTIAEIAGFNTRLRIIEAYLNKTAAIEEIAADAVHEELADKSQQGKSVLKQIEARVSIIENSLSIREMLGKNGFEILVTFANLQNAVISGYAYTDQLKAFKSKYPFEDSIFQEAINVLSPSSDTGLATPTQLFLSFPDVADEMSKYKNATSQSSTWRKVKDALFDLASIRAITIEGAEKDSLDSSLLEMEAFLSKGDVLQAVNIFDKLPPEIQEPGLAWVKAAKEYLEGEQAIRKLEALVFWRALGRVPMAEKPNSNTEKNKDKILEQKEKEGSSENMENRI